MDITSYLLGKQAGGGGGTPKLQDKTVTITEDKTTIITADSGYDGLGTVEIITKVQPQPVVDENTLLLLHLDGNYTDSSFYARVPSSTGASINYGTGKFDQGLNLTARTQGIISYSQLSDLVTHDFTIDFWFYPTSFSGTNAAAGRPILGNYARNNWNLPWEVFVSEYQGNVRKWGFRYAQDGNELRLSSTTELNLQEWQHLAVTYKKSTKTLALFYNGFKSNEATLNFDMTAPTGEAPSIFSVGNWFSNFEYQSNGYIDEVRVSDIVRYTQNFTPPSQPY